MCSQLVMAVGQVIGVQVKEEDISTSHPLPTLKEDAQPKIIVKFTRRDTRNSFYTNRKKLIDKKASDLHDLGITAESKGYAACIMWDKVPLNLKGALSRYLATL